MKGRRTKRERERYIGQGKGWEGRGGEWHCPALACLRACLPACIILLASPSRQRRERTSRPASTPAPPRPAPCLCPFNPSVSTERETESKGKRAREGQGGVGRRMALSCSRVSACLLVWLLAGKGGNPLFLPFSVEKELGGVQERAREEREGTAHVFGVLAPVCLLANPPACLPTCLALSLPLPCPCLAPALPCLPACFFLPRLPDRKGRRTSRPASPVPATYPCSASAPLSICVYNKTTESEGERARE